MIYEVVTNDTNDANAALTSLLKSGFDAEMFACPAGSWINVQVATERDELGFFRWLEDVLRPLGGDVFEAGRAGPSPTA